MRGLIPASGRVAALERGYPIAFLAAASLWVVRHPYLGIRGDSSIYVARVLAGLDPASLGQDLMFVNDGQFRFSLFPTLAYPFIASLGAHAGAAVIAALACAAWFFGVVAFARVMAEGRTVWVIVAAVAFLPAAYGEQGVFAFAETGALPRPFAEAMVLLALADLLKSAWWRAAGWLGLAVCVHPVMALAGVAVFVVFGTLDRSAIRAACRTFGVLPVTLAAGLVLGATLAGLALSGRLVTPSQDWIATLRTHSPHLFPSMWSTAAFAPIFTQAATLLIAAKMSPPRLRSLFVAILISGALGLAGAALAGDVWPVLIVVQAQPWRMTWLVAAAGACTLGLCAGPLWHDGGRGRTVLALLLIGWTIETDLVLALAVNGAAALVQLTRAGILLNSGPVPRRMAGVTVVALAVALAASPFAGPALYVVHASGAVPPPIAGFLRWNLLAAPLSLTALAVVLASGAKRWRTAPVLAPGAVFLAIASGLYWDRHAPGTAFLEQPAVIPEFEAMAAGRPREILWADGQVQAWYVLGRPQYMAEPQSFGMVFSERLATEWTRRARVAIAAGLARPRIITPWVPPSRDAAAWLPDTNMEAEQIAAFCGRPDAPGVIALPLKTGAPPIAVPDMFEWRLPQHVFMAQRDTPGKLAEIEGFGFVPCAQRRPYGAPMARLVTAR